jgi:hypothetical protein
MEYLMTYGWAILIISIVLGSLFSLGVFSTSSFASTACIPSSGYYCSVTSFTHGPSANIVASIGQSTGASWAGWGYSFCAGCTLGATGPSTLGWNTLVTAYNALPSGGQVTVVLSPASTQGVTTGVGAVVSGTIWVCWSNGYIAGNSISSCTASTSNTMNYAQIATLTAKST